MDEEQGPAEARRKRRQLVRAWERDVRKRLGVVRDATAYLRDGGSRAVEAKRAEFQGERVAHRKHEARIQYHDLQATFGAVTWPDGQKVDAEVVVSPRMTPREPGRAPKGKRDAQERAVATLTLAQASAERLSSALSRSQPDAMLAIVRVAGVLGPRLPQPTAAAVSVATMLRSPPVAWERQGTAPLRVQPSKWSEAQYHTYASGAEARYKARLAEQTNRGEAILHGGRTKTERLEGRFGRILRALTPGLLMATNRAALWPVDQAIRHALWHAAEKKPPGPSPSEDWLDGFGAHADAVLERVRRHVREALAVGATREDLLEAVRLLGGRQDDGVRVKLGSWAKPVVVEMLNAEGYRREREGALDAVAARLGVSKMTVRALAGREPQRRPAHVRSVVAKGRGPSR